MKIIHTCTMIGQICTMIWQICMNITYMYDTTFHGVIYKLFFHSSHSSWCFSSAFLFVRISTKIYHLIQIIVLQIAVVSFFWIFRSNFQKRLFSVMEDRNRGKDKYVRWKFYMWVKKRSQVWCLFLANWLKMRYFWKEASCTRIENPKHTSLSYG